MQPKFTKDEERILKAFSNVIKSTRKNIDKSQRMLAFEYDIQRSMISRFESGTNEPKLFSIWRLANAFGMKPSELFTLIEKELGDDITLIDN